MLSLDRATCFSSRKSGKSADMDAAMSASIAGTSSRVAIRRCIFARHLYLRVSVSDEFAIKEYLPVPDKIPTPTFVLDLARLRANLETANRIREAAGCKILLATKAFALPDVFPMMRDYLDGTTASGEQEARLGAESFGKEVHVYSPAYASGEVERLAEIAQHIYFNSAAQLERYAGIAKARGAKIGLRINPGYSNATLGGDLYDPCAPMSRFGEVASKLDQVAWADVDILH